MTRNFPEVPGTAGRRVWDFAGRALVQAHLMALELEDLQELLALGYLLAELVRVLQAPNGPVDAVAERTWNVRVAPS